jgi:hypothetical protein
MRGEQDRLDDPRDRRRAQEARAEAAVEVRLDGAPQASRGASSERPFAARRLSMRSRRCSDARSASARQKVTKAQPAGRGAARGRAAVVVAAGSKGSVRCVSRMASRMTPPRGRRPDTGTECRRLPRAVRTRKPRIAT